MKRCVGCGNEKHRAQFYKSSAAKDAADGLNRYCKHCTGPIMDFHHRCENNKPNRKLFPKFIHSPMNCVGICRTAHETGIKERYRITLKEAAVYEKYLEDLCA